MDKVRVFCAGKINLTLNISGKDQKSGLHYIDSLMQSIDSGDYITVAPRLDDKVNISFLNADIDPVNNTVKKTVEILQKQFGDFGADIVIEKNLPVGGGLGGSSADAAAALIAFDKLFDFSLRGLDLYQAAKKIGSDVPFMLKGGCALIQGTGEKITPCENNLQLNIVIASAPNTPPCLSGQIYKLFDGLNPSYVSTLSDNQKLMQLLKSGNYQAVKMFSNALTQAAESHCKTIHETQSVLIKSGAINAQMTGSGNRVCGFFVKQEEAKNAASLLIKKGYYTVVTRSINYGTKVL